MSESGEPIDYDAYEHAAYQGEWPNVELDLKPPDEPASFTQELLSGAPALAAPDIRRVYDHILENSHFHERYARSTIEHDVIGLLRHLPDGSVERYSHKLDREQAKGKHESAVFGLAQVGEHPVVLYAMDWDFFAGSFGAVSGEKFQMATDLAKRRKLPMVSLYATSGVRQHENYAGLIQMPRAVHALHKLKAATTQPNIALLIGNVWGGISASVAPLADTVVAVRGTEYGFSGPNVIEAYEGVQVEKGKQRAESHAVWRNVDALVDDEHEALAYIDKLLTAAKVEKQHKISAQLTTVPRGEASSEDREALLSRKGMLAIHVADRALREVIPSPGDLEPIIKTELTYVRPSPEELYQRYEALVSSGVHPDSEFFTQQVFSGVVPLYNRYVVGDKLHYPAIISSIGRIGAQPFLVVGGQASYQRSFDGLRRIPASPAPADYEYLERMLDLGERWRLPAIFFTDTLGAKPTLASEEQNQMRSIARAIERGVEYKYPVLSVVTGVLGSGGGLSVGPNADYFAMLENSFAFVAEARSSASILYKTGRPTREQVINTLDSMRATAHDQKDLKLIDEVIPEGDDPYKTAMFVHRALVKAYAGLQELSNRQLLHRRDKRIRNPGGLKVKRRH